MKIDRFRHEDMDTFLHLASAENWICGRGEFNFLLRHFPQGCLAVRMDGAPVAFITSIKYGKSAWIGNLVVRKEMRGKGIGSSLMKRALADLVDAGARTVWLTASEAGKRIYERSGFAVIDMVKRWFGMGTGGLDVEPGEVSTTDILAMDHSGWGDMRESILTEFLEQGTVMVCNGGFLIGQPAEGCMQLGPWGAVGRHTAKQLLDAARIRAGDGTRIFLDAPVRNVDAAVLLHSRGFTLGGSALLMYLGEKPAYDPTRIYALASMGSMG
jgi:ribosomal protein S18 acetylase RimI-like enzyme